MISICSRVWSSFHQLRNCSSVDPIVDINHCGIDLTSFDDLTKRCSARLYSQRCCAADRGGIDLCSSIDLTVDNVLCSGYDLSLTSIFAAVCSRLQRFAAVIQLCGSISVKDLCGGADLFVDSEFCSGVDLNALMIFAVVLIYSLTSSFAVVRIYSALMIFVEMLGAVP